MSSSYGYADLIPENGMGTASSQLGSNYGFNRLAVDAYNGSGITNGESTSNPDGYMWESTGAGYGGVDTNPWYEVDLGADYSVSYFHVWNYNEIPSRGVGSVNIYASANPLNPAAPDPSALVAADVPFAPATGSSNYTGQDIDASFTGEYVVFQILSNQGDTSDFYGLSELNFYGTPEPEPATIGLLSLASLSVLRRQTRLDGKH
jgi:hypothetical protein